MGVMQQTAYRSVTTGTAKAKVGFIDYTQQVHNERVVTADSVFTEAVSTSLLKNMGEQKYFKDGAILVRYASSVNAEHTQWSDDIIAISQEDYESAYGQDPRNLTNYVVSQDTVQNAVMEETGDGTYAITFDLEPEGASVYYKRQVRTYGGASRNPIFHSVHMVWTIDSEWRILQMDTVENYDIVMPGIGSPNCTGTLTEVFSDFGAVTDDQSAFQNYLEALRQNGSGFVRTELSRIFLTDLYEGSKRAAVYAKAGDASEFLNQWLGKYGSIEEIQQLVKECL